MLVLTANASGGGARHIADLYSNMDGFKTYYAGPSDGELWEAICSAVDTVIEVPFRRRPVYSLWLCLKIFYSIRPDVVHTHGHGAGLYGRFLGGIFRAKVCHTYHGLHFRGYTKIRRVLYIMLERALASVTMAHICVGSSEANAVIRYKLAPVNKLRVIPNGVNFPSACTRHVQSDKIRLSSISRISYMKGVLPLIEAFASLPLDVAQSCKLTIYGDSQVGEEEYYRQVVQAASVLNTISIKPYSADLSAILRDTDLFVSASLWEGLPLTLLEVAGAGKYAVLSKIAPHEEVMGDSVKYFLPGDVKSTISVLSSVVRNIKDGVICAQLPFRKVESIRYEYSLQRMVHRTKSLYLELVT